MKRALLISINPEWAEKILNGKKTIEVRSWIPKDYAGWVYVAITKDNYKNHLYKKDDVWTLTDKHIYHYPYKNICGKVAFRFWYEKVEEIKNNLAMRFFTESASEKELLKKSCLNSDQLFWYLAPQELKVKCCGYAWNIDNLEVFDKPKELSEFGLTKAPQKCVWVEE